MTITPLDMMVARLRNADTPQSRVMEYIITHITNGNLLWAPIDKVAAETNTDEKTVKAVLDGLLKTKRVTTTSENLYIFPKNFVQEKEN